MTIQQTQQRLEFIEGLKRYFDGSSARLDLQVDPLIQVLFENNYDLQNTQDIGILLDNLNYKIDQQLAPEMYAYVTGGIETLAQIGTSHAVSNSISVISDSAFDFLNIYDRLAVDYVNRVGPDGLWLSDRIWSVTDKQAITEKVFEGIREGWSKFQLGEEIGKVVTEGIPKSSIKRVAETELTYAYSHADWKSVV